MALDFTFKCPLPNGLHARPASHLAELAGQFQSECLLTNQRNRCSADMKSVLALIAADVRSNDECVVDVHGLDEQLAVMALRRFIKYELVTHDALLANLATEGRKQLPRALRAAQVTALPGLAVSPGIGQGKILVLPKLSLTASAAHMKSLNPAAEEQHVHHAINAVRVRMKEKLHSQITQTESAILQAHLAMLGDSVFMNRILKEIAGGCSASEAIVEAGNFFADLLRQSENPYMRERALDIRGLCLELLESISGGKSSAAIEFKEPSIVLAENLLPQQLLSLDRSLLRGLVLESAGTTSHTVLLARSLGIPVLVGIPNVPSLCQQARDPYELEDSNRANAPTMNGADGLPAIVDANRGFLFLNPSPLVQKFYQHEAQILERRKTALVRQAARPAATNDGYRIEVGANVSSAEEAIAAFQAGADGVGVFRTEMLFMGRESSPSQDEQFEIYAAAVRAANSKPVILRTFDIGGDKPVPFLKIPPEDNPFLGYRGARIYPQHPWLLENQLHAALRASAIGPIQIMLPMVSSLEEVQWFKEQVATVKQQLRVLALAYAESVPLGIMIEVPSVAFILDRLCREVDFFSLGTNDLSQYFFAADRGNARVAGLSSVTHPGFLRFLQQIVATVRSHGKWIGLCGDMAASARNLPLLLGLELNELSVPAADIPLIKQRIAGLSLADCRSLLSQALDCESPQEVEALLDRAASHACRNLLDRELILLHDQVDSKEEAIREMVAALYVSGRTDDPDRLEEALWAREAAYSTAIVPGFAVPHCKTDAVKAGSLAVLKLQQPLEWGSPDSHPVQMVILLAARESDPGNAHLQVFSRLARNLMDENFRQRLLTTQDPDALLNVLTSLTISVNP